MSCIVYMIHIAIDTGVSMQIHSLSKTMNSVYSKEEFLAFLEQHLSYIKDQGLTVVTITNTNAYKHVGNFYGILNELNIPMHYHYVCMRVNGLANSSLYDGVETNIKLPSFPLLDQLKNQYVASSK